MCALRAAVLVQDLDELSATGAELFARYAQQFIRERQRFMVALAGGSTPRRLYERLASPALRQRVDWRLVHVYFGDERCVPPDSKDSNFRMAREALLAHVPIPPENVHRIEAEDPDPHQAALRYEQALRTSFGIGEDELPVLDLVLLGMGPDGHTASLFPGTAALAETQRLVCVNFVQKLDAWRITLTLPMLNAARHVVFLISGPDKAPAVRQVLDATGSELPASRVQPDSGSLIFLVDQAAQGLT